MFKKTNRLSKSKDIETVFRAGRSFFGPCFVIRFAPDSRLARPRIAVVVSTKVSKRAVERNRIKRIIRETLRPALSSLRSGDYVVIAKSSASRQAPATLRPPLLRLLQRLSTKTSNQ